MAEDRQVSAGTGFVDQILCVFRRLHPQMVKTLVLRKAVAAFRPDGDDMDTVYQWPHAVRECVVTLRTRQNQHAGFRGKICEVVDRMVGQCKKVIAFFRIDVDGLFRCTGAV